MCPHDGGIDQDAFHVAERRGVGESVKESGQPSRIDPAAEPLVHGQPAAELAREIPPRNAGAGDIQNRLEEHPLGQFRFLPAAVPWNFEKKVVENRPRLVRELVSHGILPETSLTVSAE